MNPTTARLARIASHVTLGVVAQVVLATATASAGPVPCTVPAAPERPAQHVPSPIHPARVHVDTPVRYGDSCTVDGATGYAQPGTRAVVCGHHRGLRHLTWG